MVEVTLYRFNEGLSAEHIKKTCSDLFAQATRLGIDIRFLNWDGNLLKMPDSKCPSMFHVATSHPERGAFITAGLALGHLLFHGNKIYRKQHSWENTSNGYVLTEDADEIVQILNDFKKSVSENMRHSIQEPTFVVS